LRPERGPLSKILGKRRYQTVSLFKYFRLRREKSGPGSARGNCGLVSAAGELKIGKSVTISQLSSKTRIGGGKDNELKVLKPARLQSDENNVRGPGRGTAVLTRTKPKTLKPSLYRVLLLNDDYTPMEFVIHVLERFFQKNRDAATVIMLHVHNHGVGECGVYTYEVAETKITQVMDFARENQHPLQCVMEKK
jgi:ATP-dependent Clp protease adaptor protein ClpS